MQLELHYLFNFYFSICNFNRILIECKFNQNKKINFPKNEKWVLCRKELQPFQHFIYVFYFVQTNFKQYKPLFKR